jgi:DNA-binding YbaB/EbfC family protein
MKDILGMMRQAQALQQRMQDLQNELEATEVEGHSGGGLVTVRLTAKGTMKGLKIDSSLVKPEETEILEDLVVAAHNEARAKADALMQDRMKELTGGLALPPGLKLF